MKKTIRPMLRGNYPTIIYQTINIDRWSEYMRNWLVYNFFAGIVRPT